MAEHTEEVRLEIKGDWIVVTENGVKKGSWNVFAEDYARTEAEKCAGRLRRAAIARAKETTDG